ncbi:magnesium/cobalt transporter CorA [soil metagenome]
MLRSFILHADHRVSNETSAEAFTAALAEPGCRFWLDMETPTEAEIALLKDVFQFHPLAIEDSVTYTQRPKVELYNEPDVRAGSYFYLVFHGPDLDTFKENLRTKEVDMFVSDRYLVSVHDEPMRSVQFLEDRCNANAKLVLEQGIDVLLYRLLDFIADAYDTILDHVQESIDELEEKSLNDPKPEVLSKIAVKKRELLNLRRVIGPQREVVAQLTRGDVPFIRETTRIYMRDVQDHLVRVVELVELYRDLVLGSRDIYLSSVSNNLNQVMKTLTIISVIGVPMSIVTGFFGMNFDEPIFHNHRVFIGALIFMGCVVAAMLILFRRKRWI